MFNCIWYNNYRHPSFILLFFIIFSSSSSLSSCFFHLLHKIYFLSCFWICTLSLWSFFISLNFLIRKQREEFLSNKKSSYKSENLSLAIVLILRNKKSLSNYFFLIIVYMHDRYICKFISWRIHCLLFFCVTTRLTIKKNKTENIKSNYTGILSDLDAG